VALVPSKLLGKYAEIIQISWFSQVKAIAAMVMSL
jgi:hypothetical protein